MQLGFDKVGIAPAISPTGLHRFYDWLDAGYAGEMDYLENRREAYSHPRHVMPGVKSLVMLAKVYQTSGIPASQNCPEPPLAEQEYQAGPLSHGQGRVSSYAWGSTDYHDLVRKQLKSLASWMHVEMPEAQTRGIVDTAPLLEREFAQLAGLGWVGKNTLLIGRDIGSWFFLAAILTESELAYDIPHEEEFCGNCTACLDACPTDAFVKPYVLDATRCISYLTIEKRDSLPEKEREMLGDWLFGCDICQEVCPWNNKSPLSLEPAFTPKNKNKVSGNSAIAPGSVDLTELFYLDDQSFRERFRKTPLWRAKRRGILRNAAHVLGNQNTIEALSALRHGVKDNDPIIQEACRWAIERIAGNL